MFVFVPAALMRLTVAFDSCGAEPPPIRPCASIVLLQNRPTLYCVLLRATPLELKGVVGRSSLNGQDFQVPRYRKGVHPGLAVRPRTPGPHPLPGGFNETASGSNPTRGLLVVKSTRSWYAFS